MVPPPLSPRVPSVSFEIYRAGFEEKLQANKPRYRAGIYDAWMAELISAIATAERR